MAVTLSSDVWPVIREYERTVTTTVAGYVQRRVANYLTAFQEALRSAGIPAVPMIGKSNGGVMTAELGKSDPISMLLSGTATGVIGAAEIAKKIGIDSILSFDVGGTVDRPTDTFLQVIGVDSKILEVDDPDNGSKDKIWENLLNPLEEKAPLNPDVLKPLNVE